MLCLDSLPAEEPGQKGAQGDGDPVGDGQKEGGAGGGAADLAILQRAIVVSDGGAHDVGQDDGEDGKEGA